MNKKEEIKEIEEQIENKFEPNQDNINNIIEENENENNIKHKEEDDSLINDNINNQKNLDNKKESIIDKLYNDKDNISNNNININLGEQFNNLSPSKSDINKDDRFSCIKFINDEKRESAKKGNSRNSLFYLGNLFKDVVNKYDTEIENKEEPRKFIEKTISHSKSIIENQYSENDSFNFNDLINMQLNEVKQNTLAYLDKVKSELDEKYSLYIQKINEYINENEKKISKIFTSFETNENFTSYADNIIFKQMDYILEIHENIFSSLEDHINLLYTFLEEYNLIQQKNPLEKFLNKNSSEILNCWFLSKINFDKISLSNIITNKNLSELVTGYLCKKRENNFAKITIQKDTKGKLSLETEFLRDNINNLKKLKFLGLPGDAVDSILKQLNKKKIKDSENEDGNSLNDSDNDDIEGRVAIGKKLKSLSIIESNISYNNDLSLPKINLPVLRKVKIKKSKLPLDYFFDSIVGQTSFLRIINMQNCKISDKDFNLFFSHLNKKAYLQDSLQYLGFSENHLSYINLKQFISKGGNMKNLKYFDLNKNNIYEFVTDNFKALPELKVLDLTDNNISNYSFFDAIYSKHRKKAMNCLVLLSNNIFISNNKDNNQKYRKYIYECLPSFKYKIKKVNLSLLFNKDNNEELTLLRISPSVKISMIKLNISYCGLKTETVWKLFKNNYGLLNLVSLNLSYNLILNNFFILCGTQDILLEKLKSIDLSMNQIHCNDLTMLQNIEKFINNYQKLKRIKLQENGFMKDLFLLYQQHKEQTEEIINRLKIKEFKFYVDTINYAIVEDKLNDIITLKDKSII